MRVYYTHDLGEEPAYGMGRAHRVYLASDIEELQQRLARLAEPVSDAPRPMSEGDLRRIVIGYLNAHEAGLAGAEAVWIAQMRRVRAELEREQWPQLSFTYLKEG